MAIILGGNVEGIYQVISKAQVRNPQQVMTIKKGTPLRVPTMTFSMASCWGLITLHKDTLLVAEDNKPSSEGSWLTQEA